MSDEERRRRIEAALRERHASGDLAGAARLGIESYGPEILGYLAATAGPLLEPDEVFAAFAAAMWQALPRFRRDSSFRTWAYAIARHVLLKARRRALVAARRIDRGDRGEAALAEVVERVRTATAPFLRTSVEDELSRLRAGLDPDDQTLLILRVDRQMPWQEIARVFAGDDEAAAPSGPALAREAAALRKRFERLKARLGEQLRSRGQG